jgi:methionyl-tRNA formyltransferase
MCEVGFQKAIVLGTSTIAFQCAKLLKNILPVEVIEYQYMEFIPLQTIYSKLSVQFQRMEKSELCFYLEGITERVLIVSAFNIFIFPPEIVNKDNLRIINYHNSLLPKYAGRNAEAWAIFMLENETGITWHRVSDIVDGGNILCQHKIALDDSITSLKLLKLQHELAFLAFEKIITSVLRDENGYPQNANDLQSYHSKVIPGNGELDIDWSIKKIHAFLRSFDYGHLHLLGVPFIILDGHKYCWSKYKCTDSNITDKNVLFTNDKSIVISSNCESIILSDIRVKD